MNRAVTGDEGSRAPRRAWLWRGFLYFYLLGICADLAWHLHHYLTTGDRSIETYEWVTGVQTSLFWPLHLLFRLYLAFG